jgi:aspartate oxidase
MCVVSHGWKNPGTSEKGGNLIREDRRANLALSENGFLFDAMTGHTYTLNRTGAHIVRQILAGTKPDELPSKLVEDFDVSLDIAAHNVDQFLARLTELGIENP